VRDGPSLTVDLGVRRRFDDKSTVANEGSIMCANGGGTMSDEQVRRISRGEALVQDSLAYHRGRAASEARVVRGRLLCGARGVGSSACMGDFGWVGEPDNDQSPDVRVTLRAGFHPIESNFYVPARAEVRTGRPVQPRTKSAINTRMNPKSGFPSKGLWPKTGRRLREPDLPVVIVCPRCLNPNRVVLPLASNR
jgi:hypothetical protein